MVPLTIAAYCRDKHIVALLGSRRVERVIKVDDGVIDVSSSLVERFYEALSPFLTEPPHCMLVSGTLSLESLESLASERLLVRRVRLADALDYYTRAMNSPKDGLTFQPPRHVDIGFFSRCAEGLDTRTPAIAHYLARPDENRGPSDEAYVLFRFATRHYA